MPVIFLPLDKSFCACFRTSSQNQDTKASFQRRKISPIVLASICRVEISTRTLLLSLLVVRSLRHRLVKADGCIRPAQTSMTAKAQQLDEYVSGSCELRG